MTDVGIASLSQGCSQVKTVTFWQCDKLTDAYLFKELTYIDMRGNDNITDVGIASLTQGCSQLQSFDILVNRQMHH